MIQKIVFQARVFLRIFLSAWLILQGTPAIAFAASSQLESVGVPISRHGIPSTNIWREGNLLYGEAVDPATKTGPFYAYDISQQKVIHVDTAHASIHDKQRNIMVDKEGNAYFAVNKNGLAK